jgi:hypothetical protein
MRVPPPSVRPALTVPLCSGCGPCVLTVREEPPSNETSQTLSRLRNDVDATVVQGLPDAQIEIDFQTGLLLVKLVWKTDTQQVVR